jgi:protein-disulfide isomerase
VLFAGADLELPTRKAAEASVCASRQGKFWAMHDALFRMPSVTLNGVEEPAHAIGLNISQFATCLEQGQAAENVRADAASAKALDVTGTPTFFIGTVQEDHRVAVVRRLSGAQRFAVFAESLDALLKTGKGVGVPHPVAQ